jgi:hypothetical protein
VRRETYRVVTDEAGVATARVKWAGPRRWFRGKVALEVTPDDAAREITPTVPLPVRATEPIPSPRPGDDDVPTLTVFEEPDARVAGFPVWLGRDGKLDRVVVAVEGFDLYNRYSATDVVRLTAAAGDRLRAAGVDLLVVNFPDAHQTPEALAPRVAEAVRAAAQASGRRVAVAGLSAGGVAARWALVTAEERGEPLPVHTLLLLDTPNRGANFPPALQAMTLRYGTPEDRAALQSPAARVLLRGFLRNGLQDVRWRTVGLPLASRQVPVETAGDHTDHDAFFARLRALNDNRGYPKQARVVAVANSSRRPARPGRGLLHVWLPWT